MITSNLLAEIFPGTVRAKRDRFIAALNKYLPIYGIDTALRVRAFLATGGVETDYLKTTTEYASGSDYEGRNDLGNTKQGDGKRFRGRGFFQTTGRYNYGRVNQRLGKQLGIDFLTLPARLAEIEIAVESACIFWQENNLNKYADRNDFKKLSAVVNCGNPNAKPNHWAKRGELYEVCEKFIPKDFSFGITSANAGDPAGASKPVALTPTEPLIVTPDAIPPANAADDSFLAAAFDKNISGEQMKAALPSMGTRLWRYVARPLGLIYAALEAGNVAAWLGIVVLVAIVIYLIYAHRADIKKLWETLKNKVTS